MTTVILRLAFAEFRANLTRLLLTAAAIVGGVGFLAGVLVYGDTAKAAFFDDLARSARNVDVSVRTGFDGRASIEQPYLDLIRKVPELSHVDGRLIEPLGVTGADGKLLTNFNRPGVGMSVPGDPTLAGFDLLDGRLPAKPGEIALDKRTVTTQHFALGATINVVGEQEKLTPLKLVGVLDFGINKRWSGLSVAVLVPDQLLALSQSNGYAEIVATARPGVTEDEAVDAVRRATDGHGRDLDIEPGSFVRYRLAVDAAKYVDGFLDVLVAFALVALVVSGFVIINTFTILGAHRARQLALLRCVGASRSQLYVMVLAESVVLGVVASAVGALASLVMGWVLLTGREAVATEIPNHALILTPLTVAVALIVGTGVTVVSALVPALHASRVPPLAALGNAASTESRTRARRLPRVLLAGAIGLLGLAVMRGAPAGFAALPIVFGGGSLVGIGAVVIAPVVAGWLVRVTGWLPGRLLGVPARLAATQSGRHPRRTAATATALMIGVALMSTLTVLVATAQDQSRRELAENFPIDFQLNPMPVRISGAPPTLEDSVLADVRKHPEFAVAAGVRTRQYVFVEGEPADLWTTDHLAGKVRPEVIHGSLDGLAPGAVAIGRQLAVELDREVGETIDAGDLGPVKIAAIYDDAPTKAQVLVSWNQFESTYGPGQADLGLIDLRPGVTAEAGRVVLDQALRDHPLVRVSTQAQQRDELSGKFSEMLTIFGGLLAVSVLIAMFGISNNLALSVFERTRESATLRAVGLSRRQLRGSLVVEAVLTAFVGGVAGVALGGAIGWVAARGLIDAYGHASPVLPWAEFAAYLALAVAVAIVAALLPARRAARATIITGLAAE